MVEGYGEFIGIERGYLYPVLDLHSVVLLQPVFLDAWQYSIQDNSVLVLQSEDRGSCGVARRSCQG
jgi:hypothetical protein